MSEKWVVEYQVDEVVMCKTITDLTLVSRFEKGLRAEGIKYVTNYYVDGACLTSPKRVLEV